MDNDKKNIDEISGVETTGHVWDGIQELNNPLPRWWLWTFYGCIVFAIGYAIYYPSIPLINEATKGVSGYSSRAEVAAELQAASDANSDLVAQLASIDVADIAQNEALQRFAIAGGASAFKVYCSQCHGSGAQGFVGYPNLNDDAWIWGGAVDQIYSTIAHGIRYDQDEDTRLSEMPAFGRDGILSAAEIRDLANYVRSLSGQDHDAASVAAATPLFADNCAACHGEAGEGNQDLGAPNLSDAVWLYGSDTDAIASQIQNPSHGVMPAWLDRLGDVTVKKLSVYVHSLGGGE
ncbi:MAG TPA: cytochrome-c oxidase, cbb3-type subunit III [Rhodospirillaceae bacterium]|nr:cytochrome-c oxidase, cbb3-type subunit III [Rhodospirillaceae bacterium]MAX62730.1 cytochrome-c oxidase, cbb3-type subunit III [Rhodospirillaceae bacterium]MBB57491.1 cytochrome-c oxidase, cbb3-type subunit III [Rhodospirillaceae bacterium]HBM11494.1 cytochrome-c oxidase, cbb3-type subunit III [Rhodospirillaceae bacterium]|tara:strand:+ start:18387 stop:19262 length:876 start_codon:yes stop_codon:yes gene_type:complete